MNVKSKVSKRCVWRWPFLNVKRFTAPLTPDPPTLARQYEHARWWKRNNSVWSNPSNPEREREIRDMPSSKPALVAQPLNATTTTTTTHTTTTISKHARRKTHAFRPPPLLRGHPGILGLGGGSGGSGRRLESGGAKKAGGQTESSSKNGFQRALTNVIAMNIGIRGRNGHKEAQAERPTAATYACTPANTPQQ